MYGEGYDAFFKEDENDDVVVQYSHILEAYDEYTASYGKQKSDFKRAIKRTHKKDSELEENTHVWRANNSNGGFYFFLSLPLFFLFISFE